MAEVYISHFNAFLFGGTSSVNFRKSFEGPVAKQSPQLLPYHQWQEKFTLGPKTPGKYQLSHPELQTSVRWTYQGNSRKRENLVCDSCIRKSKPMGKCWGERGCDSVSGFCSCKWTSLMTGGEWYTTRWNAAPTGPSRFAICAQDGLRTFLQPD